MHTVHLRVDPSNIPDSHQRRRHEPHDRHSMHIRDITLARRRMVLDDMKATICVCAAPGRGRNGRRSRGDLAWSAELIRKVKVEGEESGAKPAK